MIILQHVEKLVSQPSHLFGSTMRSPVAKLLDGSGYKITIHGPQSAIEALSVAGGVFQQHTHVFVCFRRFVWDWEHTLLSANRGKKKMRGGVRIKSHFWVTISEGVAERAKVVMQVLSLSLATCPKNFPPCIAMQERSSRRASARCLTAGGAIGMRGIWGSMKNSIQDNFEPHNEKRDPESTEEPQK